ncbi:uncharacterized protein Dmoj_GI26255, isoform A [Drosophila mojavensis]|uniref:Uncharacterized protein, isoform A n=1 Tax=Drosophila mojavensis TaxID=7230 RepID=A0A0Q9XVA9_DROMO|nr:uncharacterized protein Dmoj_GI26255, isoform A [Drosophila mojavensis]
MENINETLQGLSAAITVLADQFSSLKGELKQLNNKVDKLENKDTNKSLLIEEQQISLARPRSELELNEISSLPDCGLKQANNES